MVDTRSCVLSLQTAGELGTRDSVYLLPSAGIIPKFDVSKGTSLPFVSLIICNLLSVQTVFYRKDHY